MSPGRCGGAFGIGVIMGWPLISWTSRIGTPYSPSPSRNVRYWRLCAGATVSLASAVTRGMTGSLKTP